MASLFATVSKDEILAVTEAVTPKITKKETKIGLSLFTAWQKKILSLNLQQNRKKKMIPEALPVETYVNKL